MLCNKKINAPLGNSRELTESQEIKTKITCLPSLHVIPGYVILPQEILVMLPTFQIFAAVWREQGGLIIIMRKEEEPIVNTS